MPKKDPKTGPTVPVLTRYLVDFPEICKVSTFICHVSNAAGDEPSCGPERTSPVFKPTWSVVCVWAWERCHIPSHAPIKDQPLDAHREASALEGCNLELLCCDPKGSRSFLRILSTGGRGARLCRVDSKPEGPDRSPNYALSLPLLLFLFLARPLSPLPLSLTLSLSHTHSLSLSLLAAFPPRCEVVVCENQ